MRQKSGPVKEPAEKVVKDIRRATRRQFLAEEKIRIVLEGLRGEESIVELCRHEGIVQNLYYRWSKDFLEAGKKRLAGDTARAATSDEVKDYVDQVLVPTLKPGDVVILDNLGSHKGKAVCRAIRASGARLLFLPPLFPDLNPIEQVFAKLKHLMRNAKERTVDLPGNAPVHCSKPSKELARQISTI